MKPLSLKGLLPSTLTIEDPTRPIPKWIIYASLVSILAAVFIKLWTPTSINRWPEAAFTLTFFYGLYKERKWLSKHPMVIGLFAAIIATPLLFLVNYLQDPVRALEYAHFEKLISVYLFVPVGYWLSYNRNYIYVYLLLAFIGFITACSLDPDLSNTINRISLGQRVDFGLKNWQHLAMWSGLFLIAWLCYFPSTKALPSKHMRIIARLVFLIGIAICLFAFYVAQTRAVFLGLLAVLFVFLIVWLRENFKKLTKIKRITFISLTLIFLTSVPIIFLATNNPIKERFLKEQHTIEAIFQGNLEDIPLSSIGVRIHSWATAIKWIQDKPLIGWGGDVREHIIDDVPAFNNWHRNAFGHLHNTLIEFLVAYGILGTLIALWPLAWTLTFFTKKGKHFESKYGVLANIFFITISFFESYLFFWPGAYTLGLFAAPLLAVDLKRQPVVKVI